MNQAHLILSFDAMAAHIMIKESSPSTSSSTPPPVEIPQFFICPISLQIMRDPVTLISGITYDRDSIDQWLSSPPKHPKTILCPVTKQALPMDSNDLIIMTPNHTLRRLIQSWCIANASNGVDPIPTPKPPLSKPALLSILQNLSPSSCLESRVKSLNTLEMLAGESEGNKRCMVGAGVAASMASIVIECYNGDSIDGLEHALNILCLIKVPVYEFNHLMAENVGFFNSIAWAVQKTSYCCNKESRAHAVLIMKSVIEFASSTQLERLKQEFFESLKWVLRECLRDQTYDIVTLKAAMQVLLESCGYGQNSFKIIKVGAVHDLIEIELSQLSGKFSDKRMSELTLGLLEQLCKCADGRAEFLEHAAGVAVVSKRILRVSPMVNDLAVRILSWVCRFSAGDGDEVVQEMVRVGAVSKLCMILQADQGAASVKEKAREVLRLHSDVWSSSPCVSSHLLTRLYPR
ncbi:hypothetical protein Sjap_012504 [Stephania japonica]|uniref:U-box domain-containing protein n=1 Tax=Stephania japonica TaxID=461633 RepID=A0AAP0NWU8_9MAGN